MIDTSHETPMSIHQTKVPIHLNKHRSRQLFILSSSSAPSSTQRTHTLDTRRHTLNRQDCIRITRQVLISYHGFYGEQNVLSGTALGLRSGLYTLAHQHLPRRNGECIRSLLFVQDGHRARTGAILVEPDTDRWWDQWRYLLHGWRPFWRLPRIIRAIVLVALAGTHPSLLQVQPPLKRSHLLPTTLSRSYHPKRRRHTVDSC
jgi:hypothetical protein